jgi:hypothetical protein
MILRFWISNLLELYQLYLLSWKLTWSSCLGFEIIAFLKITWFEILAFVVDQLYLLSWKLNWNSCLEV